MEGKKIETANEKSIGIGLRDLFFYILRKWRFIICMGIVCGAILGAYRANRLLSMIRSNEYQGQAWILYEQAVKWREDETERLDVEISELQKKLDAKQTYTENSLLMQIDPYNSRLAYMDVCILGEGNTELIYNIYQSAINHGSITNRMAELLGYDEQYLRELIKLQDSITLQNSIMLQNIMLPEAEIPETAPNITISDKAILHIEWIAADSDLAEKIKDSLISSLNDLNLKLNREVGAHKLIQVDNGCVQYSGQELGDYQNRIKNEITDISNLLEQKNIEKDALEIPVYELMPMKTVFLSSLKYFLAGGAAGGGLSLIILYIICLYSVKIVSPDEIRRRTNLRVLTIFGPTRRSLGGIIDRLIIRHELKDGILSLESVRKRLELEPDNKEWVVWGTLPENILEEMLPKGAGTKIVNMAHMDSWMDMMTVSKQEEYEKSTRCYILIADRRKDTYKSIIDKLEVIGTLHGENVICILCV